MSKIKKNIIKSISLCILLCSVCVFCTCCKGKESADTASQWTDIQPVPATQIEPAHEEVVASEPEIEPTEDTKPTDSNEQEPTQSVQEEPVAETPNLEDTSEDYMKYHNNELTVGVNNFNDKLYALKDTAKNFFYSPYGIATAFAMVDVGANGETKSQIENVIGIKDYDNYMQLMKKYISGEAWDSELKNRIGSDIDNEEIMNHLLPKVPKLAIGNAIWVDKNLKLSSDYEDKFNTPVRDIFNSEIKSADFAHNLTQAKQEISDWVKESTDGFIDDYESIADEATIMDLLNAVYFKGAWSVPFNVENTLPKQDFNGRDKTFKTDMMCLFEERFAYLKDFNGLKGIALPYELSNLEMDVFIPSDDNKGYAPDIFKSINKAELFNALDNAEYKNIAKLQMPKIELSSNYENLSDDLKTLGITDAFSGNADFSTIADNIQIDDVSHKAKLKINEEGTEAAAITEMTMKCNALAPMDMEEPIEFIVDKPYVFVIRDKENGMVLFTGCINEID